MLNHIDHWTKADENHNERQPCTYYNVPNWNAPRERRMQTATVLSEHGQEHEVV